MKQNTKSVHFVQEMYLHLASYNNLEKILSAEYVI